MIEKHLLKKIPFTKKQFLTLWTLCIVVILKAFFQEAKDLSSLSPLFAKHNIPMYGILHEIKGANEFREYFDGKLYFDTKKIFFGPDERRTLIAGMLRFSAWKNFYRAYKSGIPGNLEGDGTLLGGRCIELYF